MSETGRALHRTPHKDSSSPIDFAAVGDLVREVQRGDSGAFERLYDMYLSQVYYSALKYLKDEHDAAEVTQEVFLRVYSSIATLKSPITFHKWISTITYNLSLDTIEKKEHRQDVMAEKDFTAYEELFPEESDEFLPEEYLLSREKQADVLDAVEGLPTAQRNSVHMHYFEGLSVPEIAEITEQAPDTIHKRLHDAKKTLRKRLRLSPDLTPAGASAGAVSVLTQILKKDADAATTQQVHDTISRKLSSALGRIGSDVSAASQASQVATAAKGAMSTTAKIVVAGVASVTVALGGYLAYSATHREVEPASTQPVPPIEAPAAIEGAIGSTTPGSEETTQEVEPEPEKKPVEKKSETATPKKSASEGETTEKAPVLPTISLAQKSITYLVGEHPTLDAILDEAGVFAFDGTGKRLKVSTRGYEWVDFDEAGSYKLFLDTHDKQNQSAKTAILTIEIQP